MVTTWPKTFSVGVVTFPGYLRGGGVLSVAPGSIMCTPGRVMASLHGARAVRHEGTRVEIYTPRLIPPWFNVSVPIRGEGGTIVAVTWLLSRGSLRRAFQEAGFEVIEHVTWVYRGFRRKEAMQGARRFGLFRRWR